MHTVVHLRNKHSEMLYRRPLQKNKVYLTVILRTRVVYELIADEVRSTELAIRHIRRE